MCLWRPVTFISEHFSIPAHPRSSKGTGVLLLGYKYDKQVHLKQQETSLFSFLSCPQEETSKFLSPFQIFTLCCRPTS